MAARQLPWSSEIRLDGEGPARVLLFAGFGASPETLRSLADALRADAGATVLLSALAGHVGDQRAFERSRSWHYVGEAEERFLRFWRERGTPVHLGGYSTGALVALLVAARHPDKVAALVLTSPALRLSRADKQLVGFAAGSLYYVALPAALLGTLLALAWGTRSRGWGAHRRIVAVLGTMAVWATATAGLRGLTVPLPEGGPLLRDGEEVLPPHFTRASLLSGSTIVPVQLAARWQLSRLSLPVCLVFGEDDVVVDVRFGTMRARASRNAELHVVPKAPHRVVTVAECHRIVGEFISRTSRGVRSDPDR